MDLTEFLPARVAEDEGRFGCCPSYDEDRDEYVTDCDECGWSGHTFSEEGCREDYWQHANGEHGAERWLAECAAKRKLIQLFTPGPADYPEWDDAGQQVLFVIAQPYSDHPDFNPEWSVV